MIYQQSEISHLNRVTVMAFSHIWITLPLVGAFIGWITNLIAVRMLFHPKREIRFLFISIQGVFPRRQKALAVKLGEVVASELFSANDVMAALKNYASSPELVTSVSKHLRNAFQTRIPQVIPMASMFLSAQLLDSMESAFRPEVEALMQSLIDKFGDGVDDVVNVREIVRERVEAFSSDKLEEIILVLMKKELRFVEYVGGILGFLIGVGQVVLAQI